MTRTRLGLLGLCAMVFGLMSFSSSMAQAEVGAKFLVVDSNGTLLTELEATANTETETTAILHTKIAGISVLFECPKGHETGTFHRSILWGLYLTLKTWLSCTTKLNGATSAACEPVAGGTKGAIKTNALKGLFTLHELAGGVKDDIVTISPVTGETMAIIEMGSECAIGTKVPIIGKATVKDCEGLFLTHLVKHLVEVGPLTELWSISKTAEHVATVLGSAWVFLTGAHAGLKFSGDPA